MIRRQRFEFHHAAATGDQVALEVTWIGVLAVPVGALAAGSEMRRRSPPFSPSGTD
ncbi:hypothetical protein [Nocardia sp. NPDC051981]|uniref:hypothetical protein n=1 Tax=Nocardia sp. NPDC051981 TaxID=3155417 RepID=UPI003417590D